ncbi:MAG TPA: type IV pilus twitching motility protein PilT [Acidimicrobiia bacterium]|nr:type IV pilus twitching motility protein PilT [Acidimicrobiia bacterium]
MAQLDTLFRAMQEHGASDLHLVTGNPPIMRIDGELVRLKSPVLGDAALRPLLQEITPPSLWKTYSDLGDADFGYELEGVARFRANLFLQKNGSAAVFRLIPSHILTCTELGLPEQVGRLAQLRQGLVLVTGPTGSGKSTTLAAIIDEVNKTRTDNLITIEDPIEFVHKGIKALVSHREVGNHTESFAAALRSALREDPDVIMVGEMRDLETIRLALEAASTGHLVFGTLHTLNAAKTVDRIVEVFPSREQPQIRSTLADSLKAVIAQTLFKRVDQPGRIAALELMMCTPAIANLIREGKTFQIPSALQTGKKEGMRTMDASIVELLQAGKIDPIDALDKVLNDDSITPYLSQTGIR